jgi:protein SCO1/2
VNPRVAIALALVAASALGAVLLAASSGGETAGDGRRFEGAVVPPGLRAPELRGLRDENGKPLSMRAQRGKPVIVTFLYTTCEETCPTQAQQVRAALDELDGAATALAVAVDPPRDDPAKARAFLAEQRLSGRMAFATGPRRRLEPVWKAYAVQPQREDLEHTARLVIVDPRGAQRVSYPLGEVTPERLEHDVRLLLPAK